VHVYAITNTVNGKIYVGQHCKADLEKYFRHVLSDAKTSKHKPHLYRAIQKHGCQAFTIQSLVRPIDKQQMDELEKFFIRTLESRNPEIGYNIAIGGEAPMLGRTASAETRMKLSLAKRGNVPHNKGKPCSEAQAQKLRTYRLGKPSWTKGVALSEQTRRKLSIAKQGKPWTEARRLAAPPRKTHCIRGHERTPENITNNRGCRQCNVLSAQKSQNAKKLASNGDEQAQAVLEALQGFKLPD